MMRRWVCSVIGTAGVLCLLFCLFLGLGAACIAGVLVYYIDNYNALEERLAWELCNLFRGD